MPKVSVAVPHQLEPQQALEKIQPALEKTAKDFQGRDLETTPGENSTEFRFKSMAFTIKGRVEVDDKQVAVEIDLPFAAVMFKDKAKKALTKNLTRALEG